MRKIGWGCTNNQNQTVRMFSLVPLESGEQLANNIYKVYLIIKIFTKSLII